MVWKIYFWNFSLEIENDYVLVCTNILIKVSNIFLITSVNLSSLSSQFDNMLLEDFKLTTENRNLEIFISCFDLENLIKAPTCF